MARNGDDALERDDGSREVEGAWDDGGGSDSYYDNSGGDCVARPLNVLHCNWSAVGVGLPGFHVLRLRGPE